MKSLLLFALLVISALTASFSLTSCASNGGASAGDGTYTPPPTLSPVDATDQMRSQYRDWIR